MNPEIDAQKLNAFVDGELDLLSQREIEERIDHDPGLRARVEGLRQLRASVRELADYHVAPEVLRHRVAALMAPAAAPARLSLGFGSLPHRLDRRPIAVGFVILALIAVILGQRWRSGDDSRLVQDVVASHVRSTLGEHLVDVASSDRHTVKPWLASKLDFSPPVPDTLLPGSVFLGGRIDYLDRRPVAALAYRQGQHVVNTFVWPTDAADAAAVFAAQRGFQIAHWTRRGMTHWVISDLNREEFGAVVRALEATRSEP